MRLSEKVLHRPERVTGTALRSRHRGPVTDVGSVARPLRWRIVRRSAQVVEVSPRVPRWHVRSSPHADAPVRERRTEGNGGPLMIAYERER